MRFAGLAVGACLLVLAAPAAALAKPVVTTGAAADIAQTTATLTGSVDPNGSATTYFFQFGPTRLYGGQTTETSAGKGANPVKVTGVAVGLAPATTYHYRLVARWSGGLVFGKDRTFKSLRQPLGVTLAATPAPVRTGRSTSLVGQLTGTGSAGRQVVLQSNPWPYTQGFQNAANVQLTDATGHFNFPILSIPVSTQFRVLMPQRPEVVSPIVVVGATCKVTTRVSVRRGARRGTIRFRGHVSPAVDGQHVLIQKLRGGQWLTIASTVARHSSSKSSKYSKRVRQRHGGTYRVLANLTGAYTPSAGRTVHVRVRR